MKALEDRIMREGTALSDSVLKVNSFINHMVDPVLMRQIGNTFAAYYKDRGITKVVTIEVSGIAPALYTAEALGVPLVILKKQTSKTLTGSVLQTNITSFTKGTSYELTLQKEYVTKKDNVIIIDDFLANGEAANGASTLVTQAGARIAGVGILIEKSFQRGRKRLEEKGLAVTSLARIKKLAKGVIEFEEADI